MPTSPRRARRRGTPKPPSVREVARSAGGRDMPRQRRSIKLKGTFRAPARGTFALGGKSTQKRRSNLRFENPLRAFSCCLSCLLFPREHCAVQISPKCCIVSAPLSAAAFALKCRTVRFFNSRQELFSNSGPWPPPTFAASRQRRDLIIAQPRRVFPKREGTHKPKAVGKEDSVKETHQGFLSRSVKKPIFALQKS